MKEGCLEQVMIKLNMEGRVGSLHGAGQEKSRWREQCMQDLGEVRAHLKRDRTMWLEGARGMW